jgi:DNA polymerase III epsilon subunit family exonuclease
MSPELQVRCPRNCAHVPGIALGTRGIRPIIVFDTETTGLSPQRGHRIIEIGAVKLSGTEIIDEFHILINAGVPIDPRAQAVHGISLTMLRSQPPAEEVLPQFRDFIGRSKLVAHNAPFDSQFLRSDFVRIGFGLPNRIACTLKLSRRKLILPNYRLETVYRALGGRINQTIQRHRALDDSRMAAYVWMKLQEDGA